MKAERNAALQALGLNQLEADVYLFLLVKEPCTAYKIGKAIGKPTANVYKAIDTLARKGAVLVEEGENRLCAAVPAAEFLRIVERTFQRQSGEARRLLGDLRPDYRDERVYQVQSAGLVLERCRAMLARAESVAIVDAFPKVLGHLLPLIRETADRGVRVLLQVYQPIDLDGVEVALPRIHEQIVAHWQIEQLNVVVDGRESLAALMDPPLERVHQAIWTRSLYLSCLLHAGLSHEHMIHDLIAEQDSPETVIEKLKRPHFFINTVVPGKDELFRLYRTPSDPAGPEGE